MDRLVRPLLEDATSGRAGDDFYLGHCPERVMPGRLLANLRDLSRVVGGMSTEVAQTMSALYGTFVRGELDQADMLTAELVKTTENAYRDVNIAFANQVALICEQVGGDVWKVRELVNKSPGRNMLLPGAGVGGHCIPKDPWLLAAGLRIDERAPLIESARAINEGMPAAVARLIGELMSEEGVKPQGARVALLGYAYLEDSDDTRASPTASLEPYLESMGCTVAVHDPFVKGCGGDAMEIVAGADCCVLMVRHNAYAKLDLAQVAARMRRPLFVDGRALFSGESLSAAGFAFRTLGVGRNAVGVMR
jgi:UDP-N-acetyl-D-mannosaminuronic acid dehydrogenase